MSDTITNISPGNPQTYRAQIVGKKKQSIRTEPLVSRPIPKLLMREKILAKYWMVLEPYWAESKTIQVFKMFKIAWENGESLSKAECTALLRDKLSKDQPSRYELLQFKGILYQYRKAIGPLSGIIAYAHKEVVQKGGIMEWIFTPIYNKTEYMRYAGKHIEKVNTAINERHKQNLTILALSKRELRKLIEEKSQEIDTKAEINSDLGNSKGLKRRRKQRVRDQSNNG